MKPKPDGIGETGLAFFGRTTASISHELKNALAIIKENSGLLDDYMRMIQKGMPVDPERFKVVATRFEDQTQRADRLIKDLNRFAHTVDEAKKSVDLNETLELLVALSQPPAAMRQVTLAFQRPETPVVVTTAPFLLMTALGRCLAYAFQAVGPGKTLVLGVVKDGGGGIFLDQLEGLSDLPGDTFPAEQDTALLSALGATYIADRSAGRILITL